MCPPPPSSTSLQHISSIPKDPELVWAHRHLDHIKYQNFTIQEALGFRHPGMPPKVLKDKLAVIDSLSKRNRTLIPRCICYSYNPGSIAFQDFRLGNRLWLLDQY